MKRTSIGYAPEPIAKRLVAMLEKNDIRASHGLGEWWDGFMYSMCEIYVHTIRDISKRTREVALATLDGYVSGFTIGFQEGLTHDKRQAKPHGRRHELANEFRTRRTTRRNSGI